jgi:hypothetical protein
MNNMVQTEYNKNMLHQPLRGLDGFSARASLQNRRKCWRYAFGRIND